MGEVRARLGCAALTLTLLLNLFPATARAGSTDHCPYGNPCTHEASIGTTHYDTLEEAVSAAAPNQTITLQNNVELSAQVTLPDGVTLDGQGRKISVATDGWSSANPGKYLLVCGSGVTIQDVTLDGEGVVSGCLQFFKASEGNLQGFVTLKNARGLGLNINASQVTAEGILTLKGNGWGDIINVSWGSGISGVDRCSFDGSDAVLDGVTAIYTDHSDVRNAGGDKSKFSIQVPASFAAATEGELAALGKAILYAPAVAENQGTGYLTLAGAFQSAQNGDAITLLGSSTGNQTIAITDGRRLTLDLNGFNVGFAKNQTLRISHGGLTLTGRGKLYEQQPQTAPITLWGSHDPDAENYTTLSVGKDVTLEGQSGIWIGPGETGQNAFGVSASIYGTVTSSVEGENGRAVYLNETALATEGSVPQIHLYGATLTASGGSGLYLGGYAQTTVTDSIIHAGDEGTGIRLSAGELSIHGDTVVSSSTGLFEATPGGDGSSIGHVALAVVQHPDKLPVSLTITNGHFIGGMALLEQNAQNGDPDAIARIHLDITGGRFYGPLYSENKTGFISGGTFTADPSAYLANGCAAEDSGDPIYHYAVTAAGQNPAQVVTGDVEVSVSDFVTDGEEQALAQQVAQALTDSQQGGSEKPDIGEALRAAASTVANQNQITLEQGKEALHDAGIPNSDVTIVVRPYLEISVADISIHDSAQTITLDITPKYITVAATDPEDIQLEDGGKNAVQLGAAQNLSITKPVSVTIPLTEGFVEDGRLYVKHQKENGATYYYRGSVENNVLTFTNPNGFSLFSYSTAMDVVADIHGQGFLSLEAAIAAVEEGSTIELLAENLSAVVSRNIRFTVAGVGADTVQLSAGVGYEKKQTGNTYTFTYVGGGSDNSGGSGSVVYPVHVASSENGTVTVNPDRASKGDTVTITAAPNKGYELAGLTVTCQDGQVKLSDQGSGKYTFTMPASHVTVEAAFQAVKEDSQADAFLDICSDAWYYGAVKYAVENQLMAGVTALTFEPNTTLSRAMITQMLYALEGKPSVSASSGFHDVPTGAWFAKAVHWAQSKGIITGYADGCFAPNDPLTREQLALILYNYAKIQDYDTNAQANLDRYLDGGSASGWAQTALSWAVGEGLLSGRDVNMLDPTGTATRAEVAQIMMNFCENTAK